MPMANPAIFIIEYKLFLYRLRIATRKKFLSIAVLLEGLLFIKRLAKLKKVAVKSDLILQKAQKGNTRGNATCS